MRSADRRAAGERPRPTGLPLLRADERFVEELAGLVAELVAERLGHEEGGAEGYLDAEAAARYLGTSRKRVHDLTSARLLVPDGHDGRRPLYLRRSLDAYVKGGGGAAMRRPSRRLRPGARTTLRYGRSPIPSDPTRKNGAAPVERPAPGSRGDCS